MKKLRVSMLALAPALWVFHVVLHLGDIYFLSANWLRTLVLYLVAPMLLVGMLARPWNGKRKIMRIMLAVLLAIAVMLALLVLDALVQDGAYSCEAESISISPGDTHRVVLYYKHFDGPFRGREPRYSVAPLHGFWYTGREGEGLWEGGPAERVEWVDEDTLELGNGALIDTLRFDENGRMSLWREGKLVY